MKIRYLAGAAGCLLLVALWTIWGSGLFEKRIDPAALVPDTALLYVEQHDIGRLVDGVKTSRLGKAVAAMDIGKIAIGLDLSEDQGREIEQAVATVAKLGNDPVLRELCGRSLSLAVLPGTSETVVARAQRELPVQVLLIAVPEHRAELLEVLSRAFTGRIKQSAIPHGATEIIRFDVEGTTFFAAVTNGLFVFSLNRKTVETALDLQRQSVGTLAGSAAFTDLKRQLPAADFLAFSSPERFGTTSAATGQGPQSTGRLAGLRQSATAIWKEDKGLKSRTITLIDRQRLDPLVARILATPPQDNDTLALVSPQVQLYAWTNALGLDAVWYSVSQAGDGGALPPPGAFARRFKEVTGSEVDQVLTLLEPGASLQARNGNASDLFPLPRLMVLFKVKDRAALEQVIERGAAGLGLQLETRQYKDLAYRSYDPGLPGNIQPLYAFYGRYLLVGTDRRLLEDLIDTAESGRGLAQSAEYAALGMDLEHGSNAVWVAKVADIAGGALDLANWAGAIMALQGRDQGRRARLVIDEAIRPLLDGLATVSSVATTTFFAADRITVESTIQLKPDQPATAGR